MAGSERWALAPSVNLNTIFREVVQHLFDEGPHANFFRNAVSCVVVDDYRDHVPAEREMYLSKMLQRTEAQHYTDVAAFRADLQLMYENAAAYNSRNGGKHAYEPVIHWAADLLAVADKELQRRAQALRETAALQRPPCYLETEKADEAMAEAATDSAAPAAPAAEPPSGGPSPPSISAPAKPCDDASQQPQAVSPPLPQQPRQDPQQPGPQPQDDHSKQLSPVEQLQEQQQLQQQQQLSGPAAAAGAQGSPRAANGSAGQQSSSPSSGSAGSGAPSGLEALLAACELAAEQDSAAPRSDGAAAANAAAPERRSYPGCAASGGDAAPDAGAGQGPLSAPRQQLLPGGQQQHHDDPAGSSEGAGMALCCVRSGGGSGSGDGVASTAQPQPGAGGGGGGGSGGGGAAGAGGSYLASNAFKNRRHKSKVYIKPNKVVYLPTTFVEEEFDVTALPLECELRVEADGAQTDETFRVTIKSVPRQGLSTMYCMTNVMRFQQQYLNWQIYNWTRIDNNHIKIHLQSPSPSQTQLQLQRPDLDRSASMPEVGRSLVCMRGSEDGAAAAGGQPRGSGNGIGGATSSSLKRKSDTGRYNNFPRVERRLVPEPGRDLPVDLRLSSTGYLQYPSPIPESPPASPQRRISACLAGGPTAAGGPAGAHAAALPPRAPHPGRLPLPQGAHPHHPHHNAHHHLQQQQPQQVHFHIHQHPSGVAGPYHHLSQHQQRMQQQLYQPHPHLHSNGGSGGGHPPLSLPFSLQHSHQQHQHQRGSNSSIKTEQGGTCSEDSSGPVAAGSGAADAASMPPLPLTWHPHPAGAAAGGARLQGARLSGSAAGPATHGAAPPPPAAALHPLELSQQLQELAEQLQLRAQAAGGELPGFTALQLAMAALQQQQAAATAPPPPPPAPLDLCSPADQERLLQHLGLSLGGAGGLSLHPYLPQHARGPRGSGSNMLDLEMADLHAAAAPARRSGSGDGMAGTAAAAQDSGFPQRGLSNSGAIEPYGQQPSQLQLAQLHPGPGSLHSEQQQQQGQQRRPSHGDRCRQQQGGGTAGAGAGLDGERPEADAAAKDAATAAEMEEAQHGGAATVEEEEMEEPHHIVCHPRRSGNGGGGNASGYGAGKLYIAGAPVAAGGGRILLEVGQLAGGRVSGNGRGRGDLGPGQGVGGMGVGGGLAAFQAGGLDLADCGAADIYSYLSPSKRFKVAVSADNAAAAAAAMAVGGGGGELSFLDVLSLRAAAGGLPAEAALAAALRQGGGGAGAFPPAAAAAAAAALGGRHFLPVGSEIMGQMI